MNTDHAYGLHAVEELLRSQPQSVDRLWVAKGRHDGRMQALLALAERAGVSLSRVPREKLDTLVSGRHQGVVAELSGGTAGRPDLRWSEAQLLEAVRGDPRALLLVLDGVTDPHNLGACLRSADAAGVTAVVTPKDNAADITAVVRKVACGATASVFPLVRVTNLARTLDALKERGRVDLRHGRRGGQSLYDCELSGALALVMGAEGAGMRRLTRERCDFLVSLPMAGSVSSLNVSVATGVCLFEIRRQRLLAEQA
jgi:23S rRNA (guanosine2251-2'-O)-methyltransferase